MTVMLVVRDEEEVDWRRRGRAVPATPAPMTRMLREAIVCGGFVDFF